MQNDLEITITTQEEIINILKSVMEQNYFQFNEQYYKQTGALAMGAPTSNILAEVYIQHPTTVPNLNKTPNNWIFQICRRYSYNIQPKQNKYT
jgi:hypothetical protein